MKEHITAQDGYAEKPSAHSNAKVSTPFDTDAAETSLPITTRSALEMQPEIHDSKPPAAKVTERPALEDWPIDSFRLQPDGTLHPIETTEYIRQGVMTHYMNLRNDVLSTFRPSREGLEIQRVDRFLKNMGILATDAVLELPPDQYAAAQIASLQGYKLNIQDYFRKYPLAATAIGSFDAQLDLVLVKRTPELEAINGTAYTDLIRVHELTHSGSEVRLRCVANGNSYSSQVSTSGYKTLPLNSRASRLEGSFINEGVAQFAIGKYIKEELGLHGLAGLYGAYGFTTSDEKRVVYIPAYHTYRTGGDAVGASASAFAGAALELLIARDPALEPALIAGLRDSEARREVKGRMDAIREGLYDRLERNFNDESTFTDGLLHINNILGD